MRCRSTFSWPTLCDLHLPRWRVPVATSTADRKEFAPIYSTRRSTRSMTDCKMERLSALAVFMLTNISNLVGCSTGRSAGFAPRKILSTYSAARFLRYRSRFRPDEQDSARPPRPPGLRPKRKTIGIVLVAFRAAMALGVVAKRQPRRRQS
jgi:hypothetical protein